MLYGLQASKDVKLSSIGRGLDEGILLKKTEERLSRNLLREGLAEGIFRVIAREGAKRVGKDTLVVVDPTDIRNLYARRMPYLRGSGTAARGNWGTGTGAARPSRARAAGGGSSRCTCGCGRARRPASPARTTRSRRS